MPQVPEIPTMCTLNVLGVGDVADGKGRTAVPPTGQYGAPGHIQVTMTPPPHGGFQPVSNAELPKVEFGAGGDRNEKYNPAVHQMMQNVLKPKPWDGNWLELEEWYQTFCLFCEAGMPGLAPMAKALLFLSYMPEDFQGELKENITYRRWGVQEMITHLLCLRDDRVPDYVRTQEWLQLKPDGSTAQHLSTWYQKWKRKLVGLYVNDVEILNQFDIAVRPFFPVALKEILKQEQIMQNMHKNRRLRIPVQEKYEKLLEEVRLADSVRHLSDAANAVHGGAGHRSASSHGSHGSRSSSGGHHRHFRRNTGVRTMSTVEEIQEVKSAPKSKPQAAKPAGKPGNCFVCDQPGHWAADCPEKGKKPGFPGNCRQCGKYGHVAKDCFLNRMSQRRYGSKSPSKGRFTPRGQHWIPRQRSSSRTPSGSSGHSQSSGSRSSRGYRSGGQHHHHQGRGHRHGRDRQRGVKEVSKGKTRTKVEFSGRSSRSQSREAPSSRSQRDPSPAVKPKRSVRSLETRTPTAEEIVAACQEQAALGIPSDRWRFCTAQQLGRTEERHVDTSDFGEEGHHFAHEE